MNAEIRKVTCGQDHIGNLSFHKVADDNGLRLINMAVSKDMVVESIWFDHRNIHKITWIYPDRYTTNHIDIILIDIP